MNKAIRVCQERAWHFSKQAVVDFARGRWSDARENALTAKRWVDSAIWLHAIHVANRSALARESIRFKRIQVPIPVEDRTDFDKPQVDHEETN